MNRSEIRPSYALYALVIGFALLQAGCKKLIGPEGQPEDDKSKLSCLIATDFYMVHFSAYREPVAGGIVDRKEAFKPYCQEIPGTGKTYLTVDILDKDVKSTPVALRVVQDTDDKPAPLVEVPPKVYPTGIVETTADFKEPGNYGVILSVGRTVAEEDTIKIPIRVRSDTPLQTRLFMTVVVVALAIVFLVHGHSKRRRLRSETLGSAKAGAPR